MEPLVISFPATILDRSARKGKLKLVADFTPENFFCNASITERDISVLIKPDVVGETMEPIRLRARPKSIVVTFTGASIDRNRLADVEYLLTNEVGCTVVLADQAERNLFKGETPTVVELSAGDIKDMACGCAGHIDVSTGVPADISIPVRVKKISLDALIEIHREDGGEWSVEYSCDAGRVCKEEAMEGLYGTSQLAAEAACKGIVDWLASLDDKQYAYAGAAQARVKKAVAKWING